MQTNNPYTQHFNPEIEDYFIANGWLVHNSSLMPAMVYTKDDDKAVVLAGDQIMFKVPEKEEHKGVMQILFSWIDEKYFKGYDGKNIFQLMMLLDFMGVIKLKDVQKELRKDIHLKNMMTTFGELYPGIQVDIPSPLSCAV
jgi:hypothetical protein